MLRLYTHPFSSDCQKALIALYENDVPFEPQLLDGSEPVASAFAALWPIGKFPILTDGDTTIFEATSIVEYLQVAHPGPVRLIPGPRRRGRGPHARPLLRQLRQHAPATHRR